MTAECCRDHAKAGRDGGSRGCGNSGTYTAQKLIHLCHQAAQIAVCQLEEPLWRPLWGEQVLRERETGRVTQSAGSFRKCANRGGP